ncbi:hypothetical protein LSH36_1266g00005, partial [Paralvinella palmiformis]
APAGMLLYYGGPAYLLVYMNYLGRLVLGLNTMGSGPGVFNQTMNSGFNDGEWHYIRISRIGNIASLEDIAGRTMARVVFRKFDQANSGTDTALSLNAAELLVGGVINVSVLNTLPSDVPRISLRGCFEAPRFTSSGLTAEPPLLLSFEDQIKSER